MIVPNTTLLRYEMPGYATVDAAIGVTKDNWYVEFYGREPDQLARQHVHLLGAVHQVRGAAAAADPDAQGRRQLLSRRIVLT